MRTHFIREGAESGTPGARALPPVKLGRVGHGDLPDERRAVPRSEGLGHALFLDQLALRGDTIPEAKKLKKVFDMFLALGY